MPSCKTLLYIWTYKTYSNRNHNGSQCTLKRNTAEGMSAEQKHAKLSITLKKNVQQLENENFVKVINMIDMNKEKSQKVINSSLCQVKMMSFSDKAGLIQVLS